MIHWRWCWDFVCAYGSAAVIFRTRLNTPRTYYPICFRSFCGMMWLISIVVGTACRPLSNAQNGARRNSIISLNRKLLRQQTDLFVAFWGDQCRLVMFFVLLHRMKAGTFVMWLRSAIIYHATRTIWAFCSHLITLWLQQQKHQYIIFFDSSDPQWPFEFNLDRPQWRSCARNRTHLVHFIIHLHATCLRRVQHLHSNHYFALSQFEKRLVFISFAWRLLNTNFLLKWIRFLLVAAVKRFW